MDSFGIKDDIDVAYEEFYPGVTDEMYEFFIKRTNQHVGRVQANAKILEDTVPELKGLVEQTSKHDDTKYKEPELIPYIYLTWKYKKQAEGGEYTPPSGMGERIRAATEHHILSNKHHPEYWDDNYDSSMLNSKDRDSVPVAMVDGTKMDDISIAEQCADWCAMSIEKDGSNSAHGWAKMNINKRWKFTEDQVKLIYNCLDTLQEVLDSRDADNLSQLI
jgi:hypothetical protein